MGMRHGSPVNQKERELLEAVGTKPDLYRVIVRRPWSIAVGPRAYLPGLTAALIAFGIVARHGPLGALFAALLAALAMTFCIAVHEAGHLLFSRYSRGVKARMLVLFSGGGISILEGRHEDPRGAALFAAGGPIASVLASMALIDLGLLAPASFRPALLVPGLLTLVMMALNMLPIAPMDGYVLYRSWLWSNLGNRSDAELRALDWSRVIIVLLVSVSLAVAAADRTASLAALLVCVTLVVQHHKVFTRVMAEGTKSRPEAQPEPRREA
jgi:Zn-dependent protease